MQTKAVISWREAGARGPEGPFAITGAQADPHGGPEGPFAITGAQANPYGGAVAVSPPGQVDWLRPGGLHLIWSGL